MSIVHHPHEATLLAYAAGSLEEALAVVVATHAAWCTRCRDRIAQAERIGGALLEAGPDRELSPGLLARVMDAIDDPAPRPLVASDSGVPVDDPDLPRPLARVIGCRLDEVPWTRLGKGMWLHELRLSPGARGKLRLVRLLPGHALPDHGHRGDEISQVLRGSYSDHLGRFTRGDAAEVGEDVEHRPVVDSDEECICVVGNEGDVRLTGIVSTVKPLAGL